MAVDLAAVPETHRALASDALRDAFGDGVSEVRAVRGGASGAMTFRVESSAGAHLLRLEAARTAVFNPHQYECMRLAADAGIAPPVRYLDEVNGVVVIPFIEQRPITDHPGGPEGIAAATAELLARLHATSSFPRHGDFVDNLRRVIVYLTVAGRIAPGLLDAHRDAFDELIAAYPWHPDTFVSAHNDPNPSNVLYDGERLWLVDWETASRNDPFIDLAIACNSHAAADVSTSLLRAWLGADPDDLARARLALMRHVVRFYAGCMILTVVVDPAVPKHLDLRAMTPEALTSEVASGRMRVGEPATTLAYAKILLQAFLDGARGDEAARWRGIAASAS